MDISRAEQRILHLLAQGGRIEPVRDDRRKITDLKLITREGWLFADLDLQTFRKLKRRRAISSRKGQAYGVTRRGLELVRSQLNNR